jgi:hypothetical protein
LPVEPRSSHAIEFLEEPGDLPGASAILLEIAVAQVSITFEGFDLKFN